jgi:hypothetical protein
MPPFANLPAAQIASIAAWIHSKNQAPSRARPSRSRPARRSSSARVTAPAAIWCAARAAPTAPIFQRWPPT